MTQRDLDKARREWLRKQERVGVRFCTKCHTELKPHERLLCDSCLKKAPQGGN